MSKLKGVNYESNRGVRSYRCYRCSSTCITCYLRAEGAPVNINQYDKLLRQQHLATPMSPLRLTRLSAVDIRDHFEAIGLGEGQVRYEMYLRLCRELGTHAKEN